MWGLIILDALGVFVYWWYLLIWAQNLIYGISHYQINIIVVYNIHKSPL